MSGFSAATRQSAGSFMEETWLGLDEAPDEAPDKAWGKEREVRDPASAAGFETKFQVRFRMLRW